MQRRIHGVDVSGIHIDAATRCGHYAGPLDVVAIKFKCCGEWYSCIDCHRAMAGHEVRVWAVEERDEQAILCGVCGVRLTIAAYLDSGSTCPNCSAAFNPGCALHYRLYFEGAPASSPSR